MIRRSLCFSLAACALLMGDQNSLTGPVSGLVFDSRSHALRPIVGVPGAAYLGAAIASGLEWASVAPDGKTALAVREGKLFVGSRLSGEAQWIEVNGALSGINRAAWSAGSNGAAVFTAGNLQIVRISGETASADAPIEASFGDITALALDAEAKHILAGAADGIYLLSAGAPARRIAGVGSPSALLATPYGLLAADRAGNKIWEVVDIAGAAPLLLYADETAGIASPSGLGLSADGRRLFVSNSESKTVDILDFATHLPAGRVALDVSPTEFSPLTKSLALVNSGPGDGEPLFVFDAANPAVYFVPAGREQ
ncbi:MAG: hypothetical protein WD696_14515 [Bryobacteraceae bacterium]